MRLSIIVYLLIISIVGSCKFSEKKIPEKVLKSFHSRFAGAEKVKWEKEKKWYEADFVFNGEEKSALFDKKGHLLEVETEISKEQLPINVMNSIAMQFPGFKVNEAMKIESDQPLIYEVEISKEQEEREIYFDVTGKILKESINEHL